MYGVASGADTRDESLLPFEELMEVFWNIFEVFVSVYRVEIRTQYRPHFEIAPICYIGNER